MLLVDGTVEVFAQATKVPMGLRRTLCTPTVSMLLLVAKEASRNEMLSSIESEESVTEVIDIEGRPWRLNDFPPDDAEKMLTITKMVYTGETVEIFTTPRAGSTIAQQGVFFIFTLMPMNFVSISAKSPLNVWQDTQREIEEMLANDEEDTDEDSDDDDMQAAPPPPPPPPPPPAVFNGAPAVIPTEVPPQTTPQQE
jgi:hypothetical protein